MTSVQQVVDFSKRDHDRHLTEFKEYLSIPSISTLSEHKRDIQHCAEWIAKQLNGMGFSNVELLATAGHPVVYGEWLNAPGKPIVVVYGHYDVQPVDPLIRTQRNSVSLTEFSIGRTASTRTPNNTEVS